MLILPIGGTKCRTVPLCSANVFKNVSGVNFGNVTNLHPRAILDSNVKVNPYIWKKGRTHGKTSWKFEVVGSIKLYGSIIKQFETTFL